MKAVGEVQVGIGIIHPPAQPPPPSPFLPIRAGIGFENDPGEGEHIRLEARRISPLWSACAVGVGLSRGADGVLVHNQSPFNANEVTGFANTGAGTSTREELRAADAGAQKK